MKIKTLDVPAVLVAVALLVSITGLSRPASAADGKVNINQAGVEQLVFLPRIGPAVAQRIVEFREENGPFRTLEALMLVRGVGQKTYERLQPWISLEGETTLREKVRDGGSGEEGGGSA